MRRKPIRKISDKGRLVKELDRLFFRVLMAERGQRCEISDRPGKGLTPFHILCKSNYPRIRYSKENVLLVNWLPHHYNWHHYTSNDWQFKDVERAVKKLRGEDYQDRLLKLNATMPKHNPTYLNFLKKALLQQ